jgi:hypothetical protein
MRRSTCRKLTHRSASTHLTRLMPRRQLCVTVHSGMCVLSFYSILILIFGQIVIRICVQTSLAFLAREQDPGAS